MLDARDSSAAGQGKRAATHVAGAISRAAGESAGALTLHPTVTTSVCLCCLLWYTYPAGLSVGNMLSMHAVCVLCLSVCTAARALTEEEAFAIMTEVLHLLISTDL